METPIIGNLTAPTVPPAPVASASGYLRPAPSGRVKRAAVPAALARLASSPTLPLLPLPTAADHEIALLRAKVRELSLQLLQAQEAASRQIARELHDGLGAELTATRFALANVETWLPDDAPPQCGAALVTAHRSLDAACDASRHALAALHAPALDSGIVAALAQWTKDFAAGTGLRARFTCANDPRLTQLSADAALAVFRVAQEALNNVAKHARASQADVRLDVTRKHLSLTVRDDGVGIANGVRQRRGCFGVAGMRARCAAFDGTLRVGANRVAMASAIVTPGAAAAARGLSAESRTGPAHGTALVARFAWDALIGVEAARKRRQFGTE